MIAWTIRTVRFESQNHTWLFRRFKVRSMPKPLSMPPSAPQNKIPGTQKFLKEIRSKIARGKRKRNQERTFISSLFRVEKSPISLRTISESQVLIPVVQNPDEVLRRQ